MARFFAALLALAAMLQVGVAVPFPIANGTVPEAPSPTSTATAGVIKRADYFNTTARAINFNTTSPTIKYETPTRGLRNFPVALPRPA
ncbi:Uu.00g021340.m01.CDS01 [Anthostomella pinea]|uniref:Uu.00g021340.m01.CDS01 n=1 Tax=Anthostomella pinea TaxID=933095 RepID=A0AAI8YQW9_9PEZI|nr:Uu.00g021340.m01.CDS01 [Anthostomella pinea]